MNYSPRKRTAIDAALHLEPVSTLAQKFPHCRHGLDCTNPLVKQPEEDRKLLHCFLPRILDAQKVGWELVAHWLCTAATTGKGS